MIRLASFAAAVAVSLIASNGAKATAALYAPPPDLGICTVSTRGGELVNRVAPGGIGCQLGLEAGDRIVAINGLPLRYPGAYEEALAIAVEQGGFLELAFVQGCSGRLVTAQAQLPVATRRGFRGGHFDRHFDNRFGGPVDPRFDPRFDSRFEHRRFVDPRFGDPRLERRVVAAPAARRVQQRDRLDRFADRDRGRVTINVGRVLRGLFDR